MYMLAYSTSSQMLTCWSLWIAPQLSAASWRAAAASCMHTYMLHHGMLLMVYGDTCMVTHAAPCHVMT